MSTFYIEISLFPFTFKVNGNDLIKTHQSTYNIKKKTMFIYNVTELTTRLGLTDPEEDPVIASLVASVYCIKVMFFIMQFTLIITVLYIACLKQRCTVGMRRISCPVHGRYHTPLYLGSSVIFDKDSQTLLKTACMEDYNVTKTPPPAYKSAEKVESVERAIDDDLYDEDGMFYDVTLS